MYIGRDYKDKFMLLGVLILKETRGDFQPLVFWSDDASSGCLQRSVLAVDFIQWNAR